MHHFSFDYKVENTRWDRYKQHYGSKHTCFIEFSSGALMLLQSAPRPEYRRRYDCYGIELLNTNDIQCPDLYLDEGCNVKVAKSWFKDGEHSSQYLALDHERKVAVRTCGPRIYNYTQPSHTKYPDLTIKDILPEAIAYDAVVYWPKGGVLPMPRNMFKITRPDKVLKAATREKVAKVRAACAAIYRMEKSQRDPRHETLEVFQMSSVTFDAWWVDKDEDEILSLIVNANQVGDVANCGFIYPKEEFYKPYLYFK